MCASDRVMFVSFAWFLARSRVICDGCYIQPKLSIIRTVPRKAHTTFSHTSHNVLAGSLHSCGAPRWTRGTSTAPSTAITASLLSRHPMSCGESVWWEMVLRLGRQLVLVSWATAVPGGTPKRFEVCDVSIIMIDSFCIGYGKCVRHGVARKWQR